VPVDEVLDGDEVAGRAMAMIRGWASSVLTRFDGDVSGYGIPGPADADQVVSPTALEAWTTCPHAYFVKRLLRVEPPETPEDLVQISALETGSLIHEVLDRFFTRQSRAGAVPGGGQRWTDAQRGELECMVLEVAVEFEGRGVTGHPLLWRQERNRIAADLQLLLGDDELLRAQIGRVQVRSELPSGYGSARRCGWGCPTAARSGSWAAPTGSTAPGARSWWSITRPAAPRSSR
jgi:ATP-dependent helicase/nuclease subunit B